MKKYRFVMIGILLLAIIATILEPSFFSANNMINILRQASILLCLSIGLTGVVLTGNIDLSVGAVAALSGCICAKMMISGLSIPLSVGVALLVGLIFGILNGLLVSFLELPSFVSSYGINMVVSGIALMVMQGGIIYDLPEGFTFLGIGYIGNLPFSVILAFLLLVVFTIIYRYTVFGRNVYMMGHNRRAALYNGVHHHRILLGVYILCGLAASFGGVVMTARLNAADAGMCDAYGLQIVAAVVVGGTSLLGGEGGAFGTFLGTIILTLLINIMNMLGVESAWQNLVLGVIIIGLVLINRWSYHKKSK